MNTDPPNSSRGGEVVFLFSHGFATKYAERDTELRLALMNQPLPRREPSVREVVAQAADYLEVLYVGAALFETAAAMKLKTVANVRKHRSRLVDAAHAATGLDVARVAKRVPRSDRPKEGDVELPELVPQLRELLRGFPTDALERIASTPECNCEDEATRALRAFRGLEALIRRNDPLADSRLLVLGPRYVSGAIDVDDVARVLALSTTDAVAALEGHGYHRTNDRTGATPVQREAALQLLRRKRLKRLSGAVTHDRAARTVAASQRIEDVDARPWLPSKTS